MLGSLGNNWWGSFWEYETPQGNEHLFGLVTIEGDNVGQRGRELIERINNNYSSGEVGNLRGSEGWMAMVVTPENVVIRGEGIRAYLIREEKMALVFGGGKAVGGKTNEKDRYLLISEKLEKVITDEMLRQILAEKTVDEVAEKIIEQIVSKEDQTGLGGVLIEIGLNNIVLEEQFEAIKPKQKFSKIRIPKIKLGWRFWENGVNNKLNLWISVIILMLLSTGIVLGYRRKMSTKVPSLETVKTVEEKTKIIESQEYEFVYNTELTGNTGKNYENMVVGGDWAYITDRGSGRTDRINWKLKSAEKILEDEKIKGISEITLDNNKLLAFDGLSVWEIKKDGAKEVGKVNQKNLIKLRGWNGGWYFLSSNGEIWKMNSTGTTTRWTQTGEGLISDANDLAIDGKVWVSNASGEIKQYLTGKLDDWKTATMPTELNFIRVLVRAESKEVVLVSRKKLWSYDKEKGTMLNTYDLEKVGIKDAAMTDDGKEIIVLGADSRIYKVKLKGEIL